MHAQPLIPSVSHSMHTMRPAAECLEDNKAATSHAATSLTCISFFVPVCAVRNFTLFVPTDKAIQNAFRSGALNYPYLYAKNSTLLEGIVAFHAVPQYQFTAPSKQTFSMKTLLTEVNVQATST